MPLKTFPYLLVLIGRVCSSPLSAPGGQSSGAPDCGGGGCSDEATAAGGFVPRRLPMRSRKTLFFGGADSPEEANGLEVGAEKY